MRVDSITVHEDRVDVVVRVEGGEPLRTSAVGELPQKALELLPGLARHRCDNGACATFREELEDTELAHLFEHVVMEMMALAGSPRSLKGETEWDFERDGRGFFRVSLEYDDDLVCLGAVKAADRVMGHLLKDDAPLDVTAEAVRLRALRAAPTAMPA